MSADLSEEQLGRLETIAAACPVRRSIDTGLEFVERIRALDAVAS